MSISSASLYNHSFVSITTVIIALIIVSACRHSEHHHHALISSVIRIAMVTWLDAMCTAAAKVNPPMKDLARKLVMKPRRSSPIPSRIRPPTKHDAVVVPTYNTVNTE